jgi:hypothetical protein
MDVYFRSKTQHTTVKYNQQLSKTQRDNPSSRYWFTFTIEQYLSVQSVTKLPVTSVDDRLAISPLAHQV